MSAAAVTYSTQTGQWDRPQIISFDSLFGKYSIESNFGKEDIAKINGVVNKWRPFVQEFIHRPEGYCRPCLSDYLLKVNNPPMDINITIGTAHIEHPYTPDIIYKTQYQTSGHYPVANMLRAPMASIMDHVIVAEGLSGLGVPKKGLVALCSREEISHLNENTINDAFVVCSEKIDTSTRSETQNIVREMSYLSQENLANQCCILVKKTGASDFNWNNLFMHPNGKLYCLETEPLDGELLIDKLGEGFETCCSNAEVCLKERAKNGLDLFKDSSHMYGLGIFEDTAQSFLEKMD